MSSAVVPALLGVATGGVSTVATAGLNAATQGVSPASALAGVGGLGAAGSIAAPGVAALSTLQNKPGGLPAAGPGPTAPSMSDAAKQAAIDEQKRASMTGPDSTTNINGAKGILTDPKARYVTGRLLGGA